MTMAIVGTARTLPGMTDELFQKMCLHALKNVKTNHLVSGGAAWSDHVAVALFLAYPERFTLTLHLPCKWNGRYEDSGKYDWKTNPGRTSNIYHEQFSKAVKRESLQDIDRAIKLGAKVQVHNGFHARNDVIAKASYMLAYSWDKLEPIEGGTAYTWRKCKGQRSHVCLNSL